MVPPGLARRESWLLTRLPSPEDMLASSESLDLGVGASLWQPLTTNLKLLRAPEQTLPARVQAPHVGQFSSHYKQVSGRSEHSLGAEKGHMLTLVFRSLQNVHRLLLGIPTMVQEELIAVDYYYIYSIYMCYA